MISPAIVSKINMVKIRYNEKQGGRVERTRAQRRAKTRVNQTGGNRSGLTGQTGPARFGNRPV